MPRFVVLVEFVRTLDGGYFERLPFRHPDYDFSEVEVTTDTESDAWLCAAQMVECRDGIEVTRTFPSC